MAIDVKELLSEALLNICHEKSLESITISELLRITGVSRQTFYNHFVDKNDLIQYIYNTRIVPDFHNQNMTIDFRQSLMITFQNIRKYHYFMKQACLMEGQNCLKDYMFQHCLEFDLKWHQAVYGHQSMPDTLKFATEYHANASSSMTLSWILSDMPVMEQDIVDMIVKMRSMGMDVLFEGSEHPNPYD